MRALAVFPASREVRLIDQPEPVIAGATEVKLRILEAGICGTDREVDAEGIMGNLVLKNQVLLGTVNAGRDSFEEGVRDLGSFMERFPAAVRALITARDTLHGARDAVLSRGGIKSVITVA